MHGGRGGALLQVLFHDGSLWNCRGRFCAPLVGVSPVLGRVGYSQKMWVPLAIDNNTALNAWVRLRLPYLGLARNEGMDPYNKIVPI